MTEVEVIQPKEQKVLLLHHLTFPEVLTAKKGVSNMQGMLVGGPDRRGANAIHPSHLWLNWQRDVGAALDSGSVPDNVADFFHRTRGLTSPPKGNDASVYGSAVNPLNPLRDQRPLQQSIETVLEMSAMRAHVNIEPQGDPTVLDLGLNLDALGAAPITPATKKLTNPPRFACSYSQMQSFLTCPRKWAAEKYFKSLKWVESEAQRQGNVAHKILENYLKGLPLTDAEKTLLEPWKKYPNMILAVVSAGGKLRVEHEICFKKDRSPCGWWDNNTVWFRSKSDVFVVKDRVLHYFDWKHGRTKPDTMQIRFAIACADLAFGDEWDTATGKLVFLKEKDPKQAVQGLEKPITKADIPAIWAELYAITNRMESAWETETFRMQSSGLCRQYCGDKTCPHCG